VRPSLAVVVQPSFTEPEAALRAAGHAVRPAWRAPDGFALDPAAVPTPIRRHLNKLTTAIDDYARKQKLAA